MMDLDELKDPHKIRVSFKRGQSVPMPIFWMTGNVRGLMLEIDGQSHGYVDLYAQAPLPLVLLAEELKKEMQKKGSEILSFCWYKMGRKEADSVLSVFEKREEEQ